LRAPRRISRTVVIPLLAPSALIGYRLIAMRDSEVGSEHSCPSTV